METAETSRVNGPRPAATRSKVTNGRLLPMTDGRSATARRFKDLVEDMTMITQERLREVLHYNP
jgi:hypothetical protein